MSGAPSPRDLLARASLRATPSRVRILEILRDAARPLTAAEIHRRLDGRARPDLVTVYRTLERLVAASIARSVRLEDGVGRFESADLAHHHHLVCTVCGEVEPLAHCPLDGLEAIALQRHGFRIDRHSLEFFGTCGRCASGPRSR